MPGDEFVVQEARRTVRRTAELNASGSVLAGTPTTGAISGGRTRAGHAACPSR
jgi:hypothetical protein